MEKRPGGRPEPGWEFKVVDPLINKELGRSLVPDKESVGMRLSLKMKLTFFIPRMAIH